MQLPGQGWRRSSLFAVTLFWFAGWVAPANGQNAIDQSARAHEWIQVLADDDQGMELVLRAPPELESRDGAMHVPGFGWAGETGLPIEFERAAYVAVPGPRGATLEILDSAQERLAGVTAPRVPLPPARDDESLSPRPVPPEGVPAWTTPLPQAAVHLQPGGTIRGRQVVLLRYTPLQFDPGGGATYVHTVHVRLRFADRPRLRAVPAAPEPLHAGCLNAVSASRWETRFAQQAAAPTLAAQLPPQRLRVRFGATGLYQIDHQTLSDILGPMAVDAIDPTTFKLYVDTWAPVPLRADSTPSSWQPDYALQEVALWVQGEENHVFEMGDFIVFYAVGPKEYIDLTGLAADSLLHGQHPYDRSRYAWLVWDGAMGRRMPSVPSPPFKTSVEAASTQLVQSTETRLHFEEDRFFAPVDDMWYWEELRRNNPAFIGFDADLGGETSVDARLRLAIGAADYYGNGNHAVDVTLNGVLLGQIRWIQPISKPQNHYVTMPVTLEPNNSLRLALGSTGSATADRTLFLKFDLVWDRPLVLPTSGPEKDRLRWSRRPATDDEVYELGGFGAQQPWVLDVTNPDTPVRLIDGTAASGTWSYRYGRGNGVLTHFMAVTAPVPLGRADVALRNVAAELRAPTSIPDMVIVTHASLRSQAERLAQHRSAYFPGVATLGHAPEIRVVDAAEIYDEFSGGRVDPLGIRNYLKLLYTQPLAPGETTPRLRYVLLFGEATHDPRRLQPGSTPTLVPTVHAWYADPADAGSAVAVPSRHLRREYAVEDWFGEMDTPRNAGLANVHPLPDLGIGRLTPRSLAEAERLVDKLVDFDTSTDYGAWRCRVILSADDELKGSQCNETYHVDGMERLVPHTPPEWDITKIYLTEYPLSLGQKPQGRAAFIAAWSAGAGLVTYQGHGAPRQLADEVLFLSTDIPKLTNGRRLPMFMAYSCTVAEFDAPELQTMCEDLLASTTGGAVAGVGATVITFATPNQDYNVVVWRTLFDPGSTTKIPFGIAHQVSKSLAPSFAGQNNEKYVLLGDPAMTFLSPEALVDFPSPTDSLEAGRSKRVEAIVHLPGTSEALAGFNGFADVEVLGTADEDGHRTSCVTLRYDLPGPSLYRGKVAVQNGRFAFQFVVPLGAKLGSKARISAYAYDAAQALDAKGAANDVRVVRAAQPDSSLGPPRIALYFPNNLTQVKPGTPLFGEIRDENGINIQGTTLPSSILLDFDAQNQPLNVTSQFRYVDGSDSVGTVSVPLPEGLAAGPHKATLIASDNLQNRSTQSLEFDVIPISASLMAHVVAFPNPFQDRTFFIFQLTDPADVTVRVFTTSGREVWRAEQFVPEPQQVSIRWDGVDFARDELANGTYLYRVEARPRQGGSGQGPVLKHVGKVVVMRR